MKKDLSIAGYETKMNIVKGRQGEYRNRVFSESNLQMGKYKEKYKASLLEQIDEVLPAQPNKDLGIINEQEVDYIKSQFLQFKFIPNEEIKSNSQENKNKNITVNLRSNDEKLFNQ